MRPGWKFGVGVVLVAFSAVGFAALFRSGLAVALQLVAGAADVVSAMRGPHKLEGDGRAPAGAFRLSSAFGLAEMLPADSHGFQEPVGDSCLSG